MEKCVAMSKIRPDVIVDVSNIQANVIVVTIVESPMSSFYHALHKVYAPLLADNGSKGDEVSVADSSLLSLLKALDSKLAENTRNGDAQAKVNLGDDAYFQGKLVSKTSAVQVNRKNGRKKNGFFQ